MVEKSCNPKQTHVLETINTSLRDLNIADTYNSNNEVDTETLIRLEFYWNIVMGEATKLRTGSVALRSKFDYILSGPLEDLKQTSLSTSAQSPARAPFIIRSRTNLFRVDVTSEGNITHSLNKSWDIKSMGITEDKQKSTDPFPFVYDRCRYEVQLLWKEGHPFLEDIYNLAKKRLFSQTKRFKKDPDLLSKYSDIMREQKEAGILEKVQEKAVSIPLRTYYIPHQSVIREDKSTIKLRVVHDALPKASESSLNECLENILTKYIDLISVLVK